MLQKWERQSNRWQKLTDATTRFNSPISSGNKACFHFADNLKVVNTHM